ncbi:WD40 repeat domain-containing protein [Salinisphaera sp. G21_0]|uniref:WD40 repeat domain-containing protein n=1 Tax=Salinisphaera sp. G21_0 TaxID=2821094 RepID=UPI001ADC0100|nr:WD40 repeat domain-containing protein [Salinisphaera sp. G21_0]MBO9481726.1 WD40 repeat domain-containing protein [Salinisphaera sp. G21_0]
MQPIAQSSLRSIDGSGLKKDEEALINGLKPISGLVANFNKSIKEASEPNQNQSFKRLKEHLPPGWTISTDTNIDHRKLEIVEFRFSTNHLSPGTTSQEPDIETIHCDSPIESGNIDPAKLEIFQCKTNGLELQVQACFGRDIQTTCFSPTGKNLLISGSDSLMDHSLVTWRQGVDGNWSENNRHNAKVSNEIFFQFNRLENTLLSTCSDGRVKVRTLDSDGRWEKLLVLGHLPLEDGDEPVSANFSPLQDKIMTYDHRDGIINVFRVDGNNGWTRLNQPSKIRQIGLSALEFMAANNYLLTCNGIKATIWGCSDQSNCLENKFDKVYDSPIEDCQMSYDEQHALILPRGNQVFFLARDVDGNWSQVGEVRHSEQIVNHHNEHVRNRICKASLNHSGLYALTRDLANKSIISGYDDHGAWVEKREIPSCDYAIFSHSGRKVLASFGSGSFKVWDCNSIGNSLDKGQPLEHIGSDRVIFSPSENLLLSYGVLTNYVCIWGDDEEGNLVEKARVCHQGGIFDARINNQEDSVLSVGLDYFVKIQGLDSDGKRREPLVVEQQGRVELSGFSPSGSFAIIVKGNTACILGRDDNREWTQQVVTRLDDYLIQFVQFNKLENHFLIFGSGFKDHGKPGFVQLWGIGDDDKWAEKELITLDHPVEMAEFSPDGDHLLIHCKNNSGGTVSLKGATALLWKIPASFPKQPLNSP